VGDLALQVGEVYLVVIHQRDAPDAGAAQVQRHGGAQPARADHQRMGAQQTLLAFDADVVEQDVPRIPQQLVVGQFSFFSSLRSTCVLLMSTGRPLSWLSA
jgi:hypothetical protein